MKDYVSFPVYDGNEINENIEKLQNLLEQTGIEIHYVKTNDSLRIYQKVIKSSFRDATNYFGFLKHNPAVELSIPRVLSYGLKKTE